MALANYTDLAAAIPSWLHRDDLLAPDINNFVNLAEANLVRELVKRGVREFLGVRPAQGYTQVFDHFAGHPEFRVLAEKQRDPNTLKFGHQLA